MENIDEVLLAKERELKEIQILKMRSLEQKISEKDEKMVALLQKLKDLTVVNESKDLEMSELIEKNRKMKQSLDEKCLSFSLLSEDLNKCKRKAQEKDEKMNGLCEIIDNLKTELLNLDHGKESLTIQHQEEIKYLNSLNFELEERNEKLQNELEKILTKCEQYTEKGELIQTEKDRLSQTFSMKIQELESVIGLASSENAELKFRNEGLVKETAGLKEKLARKKRTMGKLKEKCEDLEFKIRQMTDENNAKVMQFRDKSEQELRAVKSQLEIKEVQAKTLLEEQKRSQEKARELEKSFYERISSLEQSSHHAQERLQQASSTIQSKEYEMTRLREDFEKKVLTLEKGNEKSLEKIKELEKALIFTKQKAVEIEKENEMLIQEVAAFRRAFQNDGGKIQNVIVPKLPISMNPKQLPEGGILNEGDEVHSVLFSEDMGPATPLKMSPKLVPSKKSTFLSKSMEMELRKRIKELETEKADYKNIIENMAEEMQNVKYKLQLSQQIKEGNLTRLRDIEKENEEKEEALRENERKVRNYENKIASLELKYKEFESIMRTKDSEIETLTKSVKKLNTKISSMNEERTKLIEISQKMSAKLRAFENDDSETDDESTEIENNKYSRKIRDLKRKLEILENEIGKWKDLESQKNELIDNLRKNVIESHRNPKLLLDFDNLKVMGSKNSGELEKFKDKLAELQAEIKKDVIVDGRKKPLVARNEETAGPNQIYQKNSEKETESQRKVERLLQNTRKSPNLTKKVRNYNNKI